MEKPIANTVSEAAEMRQASEERGLILAVGLQGRRTGAVRKVKQMMGSGELGEVGLAVATHGAPLALDYTDDDWETHSEYVPGGPLDNLGIHYADLMQFLFGRVRRVAAVLHALGYRVQCSCGNACDGCSDRCHLTGRVGPART